MAARLSPLLFPILLAACATSPAAPAQNADADSRDAHSGHAQAAQAAPAATPAKPAGLSMRAPDPLLDQALAGSWRSAENVARDPYRHPRETLSFFGIETGQTVVEITPGGGWYAEILAPWLRTGYVAAVVDPQARPEGRARDYATRSKNGLEALFAAKPAQFSDARVVLYDPTAPVFGPRPGRRRADLPQLAQMALRRRRRGHGFKGFST